MNASPLVLSPSAASSAAIPQPAHAAAANSTFAGALQNAGAKPSRKPASAKHAADDVRGGGLPAAGNHSPPQPAPQAAVLSQAVVQAAIVLQSGAAAAMGTAAVHADSAAGASALDASAVGTSAAGTGGAGTNAVGTSAAGSGGPGTSFGTAAAGLVGFGTAAAAGLVGVGTGAAAIGGPGSGAPGIDGPGTRTANSGGPGTGVAASIPVPAKTVIAGAASAARDATDTGVATPAMPAATTPVAPAAAAPDIVKAQGPGSGVAAAGMNSLTAKSVGKPATAALRTQSGSGHNAAATMTAGSEEPNGDSMTSGSVPPTGAALAAATSAPVATGDSGAAAAAPPLTGAAAADAAAADDGGAVGPGAAAAIAGAAPATAVALAASRAAASAQSALQAAATGDARHAATGGASAAGTASAAGVDAAGVFQLNVAPSGGTADLSATTTPTFQLRQSLDGGDLAQGLSEHVNYMVGNGLNGAKLEVNPPELGPVELRIAVSGSHAQVWMTSHSEVTRDALESSAPKLREMLGAQGFGQVSVDVSQRSFQDRSAQAQPYQRMAFERGNSGSPATAAVTAATPRRSLGSLDTYA